KFLSQFSDQSIGSILPEKRMDPNIICEQSGFSEGGPPRPGEDGASYLRRLKGQTGDDLPTPPANAGSASAPTPGGAVFVKERRRSARFECSGSVELQPQDGGARLVGVLRDISLHGCYVETPTTYSANTLVSVNIEVLGVRFCTQARVRVIHPSAGMGMCFTETTPEEQTRLKEVLRAIAADRATPRASTAASVGLVPTSDLKIVVEQLTEYFQKHSSLSRDEFYAIAKRVRR